MTFRRKVFINISDIPSYIGQNKWSIIEPFNRLWMKSDSSYQDCLNILENNIINNKNKAITMESNKFILENKLKSKLITKKEFNSQVKEIDKQIIEINDQHIKIVEKLENITLTQINKVEKNLGLETINTIKCSKINTKDKRKIVNDSIDKLALEGKIKEEQRLELLKQTESLINKTHGTINEQSAIDIFENKYNVKLDTSQKYYKYLLKSTDNIDWYIGGKLDGIAEEEKYIVEVKNRVKCFFNSVRDYELTQIQLYLLLTNFENAKLVEKYNKNIKVTEIEIDKVYISEVLCYIKVFIDSLELFINDHDMKMKYLNYNSDTDKQKFLSMLYIDKINKIKYQHQEEKIIRDDYMSDLDSDLS